MNALTAALKEELNVEMISLGGLQVPASVVVSWGIMLFLVAPVLKKIRPTRTNLAIIQKVSQLFIDMQSIVV